MILTTNSPKFLVSAIVSTFNAEKYIRGRLQNLIDQTLFQKKQLEIIVVDSCSHQNEAQIVREFMQQFNHFVYVRTSERESVYGAWNRGIGLASGHYIINANTDDRFTTDALEQMADVLSEDDGVHAVYGDWLQTSSENDTFDSDTRKELINYPKFNPILLFHGQITSHAALIRKNVFDQIGRYNDIFKVYGDREFMLRFSVHGLKAKKVPAVVGLYYKNPNGLEFSEKDLGDLEFKKLLDQFLLPEYFVRLFNRDEIPAKKDLAHLYACAGQLGMKFFNIDGQPVSNPGTAGLLFSKALEYDEANLVSLNNFAIIASASGEANQGIQLFKKALAVTGPNFGSDIQTNIDLAKNGSPSLDDYNWCGTGNCENHKPKETTMKSPQEMYQDSQTIINAGRYEDGIAELQKLLQICPDYAAAHNDLGVLFYHQGDKERALQHYEQASSLQPENITLQKNLADFYYVETGRVEDALRIYVRVLESHPEDIETLMITGHICVALQKFEDARYFYQRVLEIEPWNSEASRNLDKLAGIVSGNDASESADEMYQSAQIAVEEGRNEEAILKLETLLDLSPDFAIADNDLGVLHYQAGDKDRARVHYEKAVQLNPENTTFQKNLADFYYVELGRVEDALRIYVRILESHPEDVETLLITGHICVSLEKFDDAQDFYHRVLEIEPWNSDAGQNLAKLRKILDGNVTSQSADELYQTAQKEVEEGRFEAAIQTLEMLITTSPDLAKAHNDLGVLYYKTGDKERSRQHYEQAAQLEPGDMTFQKNLADFYCIETDQLENALQIYVRVLETYPEDIEALMAIGYICERVNKPDDARDFYNQILGIEPWNMDARQKLDNLNVMGKAI
jgi:Flp pilus assembly protein TadD/glycosyltransferase involved in cell wall biosynthesis